VTGRWPNRDPIGERGGINLYVIGSNNILDVVDYLGLREKSHGTTSTYRVFFEDNSISESDADQSTSVDILIVNGAVDGTTSMANTLGATGASITIRGACKCENGVFKPTGVRITMTPLVYYDDRLTGTSTPTRSQIETDEQEHVDDIVDWLHDGDKNLVSLLGVIDSGNTFSSITDCRDKVESEVKGQVIVGTTGMTSYKQAANNSANTRHANGGHHYGALVE